MDLFVVNRYQEKLSYRSAQAAAALKNKDRVGCVQFINYSFDVPSCLLVTSWHRLLKFNSRVTISSARGRSLLKARQWLVAELNVTV